MIDDEAALELLATAYFNQDWQLDAADQEGIVRNFMRGEEPEAVARAAAEIEAALEGSPSEEQLAQLWLVDYRANFDPPRFGMTHRQWFERMLELLRA